MNLNLTITQSLHSAERSLCTEKLVKPSFCNHTTIQQAVFDFSMVCDDFTAAQILKHHASFNDFIRRHGVDLLNKRIRFYFLSHVSAPIYSISFLTEQLVFNMYNCRSLILKVSLKSILWLWSGILMQFWQFRLSPNLLQGARTETERSIYQLFQ